MIDRGSISNHEYSWKDFMFSCVLNSFIDDICNELGNLLMENIIEAFNF